MAAASKLTSILETSFWELLSKYNHFPHPCSYYALGKKLIARRDTSEEIASAGKWESMSIIPVNLKNISLASRDTNIATSEIKVLSFYRELSEIAPSQTIRMSQI